jgi:hypothetical protein
MTGAKLKKCVSFILYVMSETSVKYKQRRREIPKNGWVGRWGQLIIIIIIIYKFI